MIFFHLMINRFCPIQNAGFCGHKTFHDHYNCPMLAFYHCLVAEDGEIISAMKECGEYTLQGAYFGSWNVVGYIGVQQTPQQAEAMRAIFNRHDGEHNYGPGIHALGAGTDMIEQFKQEFKRLGAEPPEWFKDLKRGP